MDNNEGKIFWIEDDDYYIDINGNRYSRNKWRKEEMEEIVKSNKDCYGCCDCCMCTGCIECDNCVDSFFSKYCSNSMRLIYCENCHNCTDCENCSNCKNSERCEKCKNCEKCERCEECNNCRKGKCLTNKDRTQEEELKKQLMEKAEKEQNIYREWLLAQEPEEILQHTYEYTMREDILLKLNDMELDKAQLKELLKSPDLMDGIYQRYTKFDTKYMELIEESVKQHAKPIQHEEELE